MGDSAVFLHDVPGDSCVPMETLLLGGCGGGDTGAMGDVPCDNTGFDDVTLLVLWADACAFKDGDASVTFAAMSLFVIVLMHFGLDSVFFAGVVMVTAFVLLGVKIPEWLPIVFGNAGLEELFSILLLLSPEDVMKDAGNGGAA